MLNCSNKGHCPQFLTLFFFTVQLQIEEISRKLRTGDFGISQNPEERFDKHTRNTRRIYLSHKSGRISILKKLGRLSDNLEDITFRYFSMDTSLQHNIQYPDNFECLISNDFCILTNFLLLDQLEV